MSTLEMGLAIALVVTNVATGIYCYGLGARDEARRWLEHLQRTVQRWEEFVHKGGAARGHNRR